MDESIMQNTKEVELYMLAQFIDVIEVLEKFTTIEQLKTDIAFRKKIYLDYIKGINNTNDFFSITLNDKNINTKLKNNKEIYSNTADYIKILEKIEKSKQIIKSKLKDDEKKMLESLQNSIQEKCKYETILAYKIGVIDGMKTKNKCT